MLKKIENLQIFLSLNRVSIFKEKMLLIQFQEWIAA